MDPLQLAAARQQLTRADLMGWFAPGFLSVERGMGAEERTPGAPAHA